MIWPAVNTGSAYRISTMAISTSHTKSGISRGVMPGQRMEKMVVTRLMAPATLPKPLTSRARTQ